MNKQKSFIICFMVILYSVLVFYGIKQVLISTGKSTLIMTDNWTFYKPKKEKNIVDKLENKFNQVKTSLENKSNNYFPLYLQINSLYENLNFNTNSLIHQNIPIRTNSDGEYLFYNSKDNFYFLENKYSKEELEERYNKQLNFFNNLSKKDIKINIYLPTRYELTTLKENNINNYVARFKKDLDKKISISTMNINSVDEYKDNFYLTDHHWNMYGAISGYKSIMNMLGKEPIDNLKVKKVSDIKYYGSMAKTAMNHSINDYLLDVDINLDYDVLINGKEKDKNFKPRVQTKKNNIYYDYYVGYFNGQYNEVIYDYHNNKDNLLILCDSYAWQIDYLIAASYNKTYVVNLRYGNNKFDIEKYMKDNNIKEVLFLYEGNSLLFDTYNYDFIGKVD